MPTKNDALVNRLKFDSMDKIMDQYMASLALHPFTYNGRQILPYKRVQVSPTLFRRYTCPEFCGGCCFRLTLIWLPEEIDPQPQDYSYVKEKIINVNGKEMPVYWDDQSDVKHRHYCRNRNDENGRCEIYTTRPFHCRFELLKIAQFASGKVWVGLKKFGRGWEYKRVDGERGALCEVYDLPTKEEMDLWIEQHLNNFLTMKTWADYFGIETHLPEIIEYVRTGPHKDFLELTTPYWAGQTESEYIEELSAGYTQDRI